MSAPKQEPVIDLGPAFAPFGVHISGEREERLRLAGQQLSFGVKFLDAALGGIAAHDMVLIGAKTGAGKTTLASVVAETNAEAGKRVHYFALEAEPREIERRIKFRVLSYLARMRNAAKFSAGRINYLDWCAGKLEPVMGAWEGEADRLLSERYKTLHTYYRKRDFTADDLEKTFLAIQDETDLIILDHLHMVDYDDPSENRGVKQIVKRLRDVALEVGKPVLIVAHLRKTDSRSRRIIPDLDDFHGTSDIVKICTKAILLAPAFDQENEHPHLWQTYIHPAKCRAEGSRTRYVGMVPFNVHKGRYEESFELGRFEKGGEEFKELAASQFPAWAQTEKNE
jgi:replicative DNA helicase